jgi:hypothetical protein
MASTTTTLAAFVLGAAAGTGGTIATQTITEDRPVAAVCEYDASVDAIICKPDAAPAGQ